MTRKHLFPRGPFGLILTDPPWAFETYSGPAVPQRAPSQHYRTLSINRLAALPVGQVAARDCVLLMWTYGAMLEQSLALGVRWVSSSKPSPSPGKLTRSGKRVFGLGHWSRQQEEFVLLFTCGHPKPLSRSVRQAIDAPVREHSRKPDEIYERAEALARGPYLEMFARQRRRGWSAWGNQVDRFGGET
jgi:N6-adenosine-specific RNA methylase IME4